MVKIGYFENELNEKVIGGKSSRLPLHWKEHDDLMLTVLIIMTMRMTIMGLVVMLLVKITMLMVIISTRGTRLLHL